MYSALGILESQFGTKDCKCDGLDLSMFVANKYDLLMGEGKNISRNTASNKD